MSMKPKALLEEVMRGQPFQFDEFRVYPSRGVIVSPEKSIRLAKKSFGVLLILALAEGEILTREELLDAVWPGIVICSHGVDTVIWSLRQHLPYPRGSHPIETVYKRGYRFASKITWTLDSTCALGHNVLDHYLEAKSICAS
jgi:DNA-binding winged helix-turn-helix (wHTH) protein